MNIEKHESQYALDMGGLWPPLRFTVAMATLTGLATWLATVGTFIRWMTAHGGGQAHTIPELLFRTNVGWKEEALIVAVGWLVGAGVLYGIVYGITKSPLRTQKTSAVIQLLIGAIYILLMAMSTVGLWSVPK